MSTKRPGGGFMLASAVIAGAGAVFSYLDGWYWPATFMAMSAAVGVIVAFRDAYRTGGTP